MMIVPMNAGWDLKRKPSNIFDFQHSAGVRQLLRRGYRTRVLTEFEDGPTPDPEPAKVTVPQGMLRRNARFLAENPDIPPVRQRLLIAAKDRRKNCIVGQRYSASFGGQYLASGSWLRPSRSVGDYFTILAQGRSNSFHQVNQESPVANFEQLGFRPDVAAAVGHPRPTLIQCLAAEPILAGWNAACLAETGNGKTLAYLAPLVSNLLARPGSGDRRLGCILVLCPTADLAAQVASVADSLCQRLDCGLSSAALLADADLADERMARATVVVGVPSRIRDFLRLRGSSAGPPAAAPPVVACVLDEADCLLDDSFRDSVMQALRLVPMLQSSEPQGGLPVGTQVVLASATLPPALEESLGDGLLTSDSFARVTTPFAHRPPAQTAQLFVRTSRETKTPLCLARLRRNAARRLPTLVFCNSTAAARELAASLPVAAALHGGLPPTRRLALAAEFAAGRLPVLVATDLASRGLDTLAARQLVNFDLPGFPALYLHRLGRVGRVGSSGSPFCVSYATEKYEVRTVQAVETAARLDRPLSNLDSNLSRHFRLAHSGGRAGDGE